MPGLATELRELIEGSTKSKRRHREIIKWMQKKRLLRRGMRCQKCKHKMKFKESVCVDNYAWVCKHHNHRGRKLKRSIRHKSMFSKSKVSLFNWMRFVYRFAQGLRLRQVDMINDDISGSSATLSKMAQKLRDVCTTAMDRYQRRTGQYIGGRQEFVTIDESHFRHKRKYGRGRMAGGWKRKKWVFGMLGVNRRGKRHAKPVLRLVERRRRRDLVPLIAHHVKVGSTIISDEWRAYRNALPQLGYTHFTVNHSVSYVDAQTGAHTQHIERAWRMVKENVWRLRGNRTEELLVDHLRVIEWYEWLARKHRKGPLGRIIHDIAVMYRH
ncbi:uncharacterized protein LOC118556654 [Fundulus heteroclitus]|uniref:uncharacterized protein LOC118556654 n=1 Tax=Fundulus heteroclitus TaxID=8078 RepID=UPI00165CADA0|nr:uncharacterized protein LOC118556654 [Fundulus heteroclitus]